MSTTRRDFAKLSAAAAAGAALTQAAAHDESLLVVDDFDRPDSFYYGHDWHSLNPGYWKIEGKSLRRRITTVGGRGRKTGFPFHAYMETEYDFMPPYGMVWRRDWQLKKNFRIAAELTVRELPRKKPEPGYSLMGVCFGSRNIYESWSFASKPGDCCWYAAWRDDQTFGVYDHSSDDRKLVARNAEIRTPELKVGDKVRIEVETSGDSGSMSTVDVRLIVNGQASPEIHLENFDLSNYTDGFFGLVGRGWLDFEVNRVSLDPKENARKEVSVNELRVCYPLGDTLHEVNGKWHCRFIAVFRQEGRRAEIRIADKRRPEAGWMAVEVAGDADVVTNDFRRATAVIDCELPANPAAAELYYTVWKDNDDVTLDNRVEAQKYIGRLPQLKSPYRLCGLSCHAINGRKPGMDLTAPFQENWIHPQPLRDAFLYSDHYEFQVMLWEDDVWYLELLLYPTSTDDAYQIIFTTLANPTTRWQMMSHWNVINPGDHDHGMDDVKGPEQLAIRNRADLGQDPEYMQRNFKIVQHLITGDDSPSGTENPKRWHRWKMPNQDFSLLVIDSRLWRTSQDTHIWETEGWSGKGHVYDRKDVTRSLLGEEQFSWLEETIKTDTSSLMCLTGINGLHTIWQPSVETDQRNRIAADFAGWVKAGCDRVLDLISSREGIVTVYGDVHVGSIVRNREKRIYECSFGPIGRTGGRRLKSDFGPQMEDYDGRPLDVVALYHQSYEAPDLRRQTRPGYWNFLEMNFNTKPGEPRIGLQIRKLEDVPGLAPRGGGFVNVAASTTGRPHDCRLPEIKTLPDSEVRLATLDGRPIRGSRSLADGTVPVSGLVGIAPGTKILMTAIDGDEVEANVVETMPLA